MPKINIKKDYMLWGLKKAPKNKIKEVYGIGEKPKLEDIPDKIDNDVVENIKTEKDEKPKEFKLKKLEEYTVDDIEYLEEEYDKLDAIVDKMEASDPNVDEIINLQNDMYEIIEELKLKRENEKPIVETVFDWDKINKLNEISEINRLKYIDSRGTDLNAKKKWEDADKEIAKMYKAKGTGFKKGSPEAKEHARKMAEAKKAKNKPKTEEEVKEKVIKSTKSTKSSRKRVYYQFKPIPSGYRAANEDEAILANKVGQYGLFVVNPDKIKYYEEYDYLLSENLPIVNVRGYIFGLKRKIKRALQDIEIAKSRLSNNPDNNKYKNDLEDAKNDKSLYTKFYKWYSKKYKIPYEKIKLEKYIPVDSKLKPDIVIPNYEEYFKKPVDFRKTADEDDNKIKFSMGDINIFLYKRYFDKNGLLKSSIAKKLYDKNILLESQYYKPNDRNKYFYSSDKPIIGGKFRLSSISQKLNPITWVGKKGQKGMAQLGKVSNKQIMPAVVEIGKPIYDQAVMDAATTLTGNPELGKMAGDYLWNKYAKNTAPNQPHPVNLDKSAKHKRPNKVQIMSNIGVNRFMNQANRYGYLNPKDVNGYI